MMKPSDTLNRIMNRPDQWDFSGARELFAGVDLGTCKSKVIVVDEQGLPRAAAMRRSEGIGSGLIIDYFGTLTLLKAMMEEIRSRSRCPSIKGPPPIPRRRNPAICIPPAISSRERGWRCSVSWMNPRRPIGFSTSRTGPLSISGGHHRDSPDPGRPDCPDL